VSALLEIHGLRVHVPGEGGRLDLVHRVDLSIADGESVGLVGESGSGKSTTARAVLRLLPPGAKVEGSIRFEEREVLRMSPSGLRAYRAGAAAMIFQDPRAHTNPLRSVGDFLTEGLRLTRGLPRRTAEERACQLLGVVGVRDPRLGCRSTPTSCRAACCSGSRSRPRWRPSPGCCWPTSPPPPWISPPRRR
jgi:ABC-type glutathione transport system ATPase component